MTIRKLAAFVPLALLVGAVVHVAVAGFDHAPGGRLALDFFAALGTALVSALAAAFFAGVFGSIRSAIATRRERVYGLACLAAAGTGVYAFLELVDGHFNLGGLLRGFVSSVPVAALVLAVALRAGRLAHVAGRRFAASLRPARLAPGPVRVPNDRRRRLARPRLAAETRRGRAPPLFV